MLLQKKPKVRIVIFILNKKRESSFRQFQSITLEVTSGASYEANKQAAKNDNLSAGNRIGHGIDAVKDKGKNILDVN